MLELELEWRFVQGPESRRGGGRDPDMPPPPPVPKKMPQPANLSSNFQLHRKMFAKSFGQGLT